VKNVQDDFGQPEVKDFESSKERFLQSGRNAVAMKAT